MKPEATRVKGGRPRKYASDAKRPTMAFRIRGDMHQRLKTQAEAGEISLSEEIERRLTKSFDMEEKIAELERNIATLRETERMLWPDESARALGHIFALILSSVRHAGGKDWREDSAAPVIVAGVVRRAMDRCSRNGGSFASEWVDRDRIASTTEAVTATLADFVDSVMPSLPPLQPQDDPANRTHRARNVVTFRDKTTGKLLQVISTGEYDITDPESRPGFSPEYRAALDRFRPIRDTVDDEDFIVHVLKDGSTVWDSLTKTGTRIAVPAGQDAPPAPVRFATPEELAKAVPAENHPKELFGEHDFRQALGPDRDGDATPDPVKPAPAPTKRKKAKAGA